MSRFLRVLVAITALVHVPFAAGAMELSRRAGAPSPRALGAALAALGVLVFVSRARAGRYDTRKHAARVWLLDLPYFIHWCACVFTLVPSFVALLIVPIVSFWCGPRCGVAADVPSPGRLMAFEMWTYLAGVVVCGYGILVRRRWFVVREIDVPIRSLDPRLEGYRIAHLSDLHIGSVTPKKWGKLWARAANAKSPDLTVVTGDLVTSGTEFHEDIAEVCAALSAKDGVYVSMGNHDYFGEEEPLVSLIRDRGVVVLRNEGVVLERDGARVYLAAVDDTWTRRADLPRALANRPEGVLAVFLAHDPQEFPKAAAEEVDLVLAGHTHGGQIAVPFFGRRLSAGRIAHDFVLGLYTIGRSTMYVSPGLGTTGPPIRLGIPPEIAILTLRAA